MNSPRWSLLFAAGWFLGSLSSLAEPAVAQSAHAYRVVVHPDNPTPGLTRLELSDLFLGKTSRWSHGAEVEVVELGLDSSPGLAFAHDIHDRSPDSLRSYRQRQVLTGRRLPPREVSSDREVLEFVRARPGAIGFVSSQVDPRASGVREIGLVEAPILVEKRSARYTDPARHARVEGTVVLAVVVDEEGRVASVEPKRSLSHGLTREAIRAVRLWRYEPARLEDRAVPATIEVAVRFTL